MKGDFGLAEAKLAGVRSRSRFRAGFEVRTLRRCERVLMYHHFLELGGPTLVRSTELGYTPNPDTRVSFLASVTVKGHRRSAAGGEVVAAMRPVTFRYSEFAPGDQRYQSLRARDGDVPPLALGHPVSAAPTGSASTHQRFATVKKEAGSVLLSTRAATAQLLAANVDPVGEWTIRFDPAIYSARDAAGRPLIERLSGIVLVPTIEGQVDWPPPA